MNENKDLLLKYLSMALPYEIKVLNTVEGSNEICELDSILTSQKNKDNVFVGLTLPDDALMTGIEMVKPYLRPMSSMTEDEEEELRLLKNQLVDCDENNNEKFNHIINEIHNLYLSHHIDFMGLIPKGLVIEVTESNNPYKYGLNSTR